MTGSEESNLASLRVKISGERGPKKASYSWRVESLRDFRLRAGINNQRLLADRSDVTQQTISFLELGKGYVSPALAARLAPILGVEAADLRLAHNLWVFQGKLGRSDLSPSATIYVLRRLISMRPLVRSPEQIRQFERTSKRLFELIS